MTGGVCGCAAPVWSQEGFVFESPPMCNLKDQYLEVSVWNRNPGRCAWRGSRCCCSRCEGAVAFRNDLIGRGVVELWKVTLRSKVMIVVSLESEKGTAAGAVRLVIDVRPPVLPTLMDGKFHASRLLGSGSFGSVFLARSTVDDQVYAIKVRCSEVCCS
jgi:hypothetical protein